MTSEEIKDSIPENLRVPEFSFKLSESSSNPVIPVELLELNSLLKRLPDQPATVEQEVKRPRKLKVVFPGEQKLSPAEYLEKIQKPLIPADQIVEYCRILGKVVVIDNYLEAEEKAQEILDTRPIFLGFDVESTNSGRNDIKEASTLSLATATTVYIFQILAIRGRGQLPQPLTKILTSHAISKVSNAAPMDAAFCRKAGISVFGQIDLQQLSRAKGYPLSLKEAFGQAFPTYPKMPQLYTKKEIDTWFNWDIPLSEDKLIYAAYDTRASYLLFQYYLGLKIE